jgi:NAD(P) transhydrogenase subunit alpha
MFVDVAVLKETLAHERRVALVPSLIARLTALGARIHVQTGAGHGMALPDSAYVGATIVTGHRALVRSADVVLAVQPPSLQIIDEMQPGAILLSFIYADTAKALVERLLAKRITCFAMERIPRISRAQAMDALSSQSALAG